MEDRVTPAARKRVRLKPEVRTRQILDAALAEFAQHGFDAARMEDIARRAGLSKAGIYAHYSGKEALLEALLGAALTPSAEPRDWLLAGGGNLRAVVEAFVDQLYDRLAAPEVVAVMRLAIAAGGRVPHLVQHWRETIFQPHLAAQQAILREGVAQGLLRPSALTEEVSLMYAPAVHAAIVQMVFQDEASREAALAMRQASKRLLLDLLAPEAAAAP